MEVVRIELRGRKAVVALVVLAVFVVGMGRWRYAAACKTLDRAKDAVRCYVISCHAGTTIALLEEIDYETMSRSEIDRRVDQALGLTRLAFRDFSVRGTLWGSMVIRIEYTVDGKPPADGRPVRYFTMPYSWLGGWMAGELLPALSLDYALAVWR